ncbi:hypothetical protein ABZ721_18920 [Streptomyces sp. NPDC006733]|uniref:hypothetical protein n=1 Tax=Streptomyces sp. NPDC006733 TaxID=3155460 RepID=UPI0033D2ED6E
MNPGAGRSAIAGSGAEDVPTTETTPGGRTVCRFRPACLPDNQDTAAAEASAE